MVTFNPAFDGLAPTKRPKNRVIVNDTMAGNTGLGAKRILAMMPKLANGPGSDKTIYPAGLLSLDTFLAVCGPVGYLMAKALLEENPAAAMDVMLVAEAAGQAAVGSVKFTTTQSEDCTQRIWLGDHYVEFETLKDDTAAEMATALAAAINADPYAPFTAAIHGDDTAQVDLTYDFKGTLGNNVSLELEFRDAASASATIVQPTGGATDPTIDDDYTDQYKMTDYDLIGCPWLSDDTVVEHLENIAEFMSGGEQGRGALHIGSLRDTYANAIAWAAARNRKDFAVIFQDSSLLWRTPPHHRLMIELGQVSLESNPAVPFQKEARGAVLRHAYFSRPVSYDAEIELALAHGLSIDDVDGNTGDTRLERLISTATTISTGVESDTWESVHEFLVEKAIRQDILNALAEAYPTRESKMYVDGKEGDVKGVCVKRLELRAKSPYLWLSEAALKQNLGGIVVRKNPNNQKRIQITLPMPVIHEYLGADAGLFKINP